MAIRSLSQQTKTICRIFTGTLLSPATLISPFSSQTPSSFSLTQLVNDISRILSDYRSPRHDIVSALTPFASGITTDLVEQVLKRCNNLGFSAHRFFLWAKNLPGFVHSTNSYHILIDILGRSKQFPLIWDFLGEIKESQSCEINSVIFWVIFSAYSRANLPSDAIRAFKNMVDYGIHPSINDLDQLLYVLCKRRHVRDAQLFFDEVKHEGRHGNGARGRVWGGVPHPRLRPRFVNPSPVPGPGLVRGSSTRPPPFSRRIPLPISEIPHLLLLPWTQLPSPAPPFLFVRHPSSSISPLNFFSARFRRTSPDFVGLCQTSPDFARLR